MTLPGKVKVGLCFALQSLLWSAIVERTGWMPAHRREVLGAFDGDLTSAARRALRGARGDSRARAAGERAAGQTRADRPARQARALCPLAARAVVHDVAGLLRLAAAWTG